MGIEIGPLPEERIGDAYRAFTTALELAAPSPETLERRRGGWHANRSVVAYDGDRIVGNVGSMPFSTLLPGGAMVPTAGLSRVGVLPSHRRRGLLSGMLTRSLREARERGESLGSLRASEAGIYGRFGYGLAGLAAGVRVKVHRSAFRAPIELDGRFEVLQGPELIREASAAYSRCLRRPGALARPSWYWELMYDTHLDPSPSIADWGVVHYDGGGRPDGFARWETVERGSWAEKGAGIAVEDLFGASPLVEAALWRFVFDLDLVEIVTAECRPIDEGVRHRLVDSRAWEAMELWDEQWVRVIDVVPVLAARAYALDETLTIEIDRDDVLPENLGRYELGPGGCRRVRRAPDLAMGITELGAALLGGTSFTSLIDAGRVAERRRGAGGRADSMFRVDAAPWCGTFF